MASAGLYTAAAGHAHEEILLSATTSHGSPYPILSLIVLLKGVLTREWSQLTVGVVDSTDFRTETHAGLASPVCSTAARMVCPNSSAGNCHSKLILGGVALVGVGAAIGYFLCKKANCCSARANTKIRLGENKVVDTVDVEDIGDKKVFCRCWKSNKFPYCDGSHTQHNKDTGDNTGPLIVKKKE